MSAIRVTSHWVNPRTVGNRNIIRVTISADGMSPTFDVEIEDTGDTMLDTEAARQKLMAWLGNAQMAVRMLMSTPGEPI